jgi:TPR repeat protein
MSLRVFTAVALLCLASSGARATPLEDAEAALQGGDYVAAFDRLSSLALLGNGDAEYELGCLYLNGLGVAQDTAQAVTWFIAAGNHSVTAAAATLGILYSRGLGVPEDPDLSAEWFRRAAEQSDATAMVLPSDLADQN